MRRLLPRMSSWTCKSAMGMLGLWSIAHREDTRTMNRTNRKLVRQTAPMRSLSRRALLRRI